MGVESEPLGTTHGGVHAAMDARRGIFVGVDNEVDVLDTEAINRA